MAGPTSLIDYYIPLYSWVREGQGVHTRINLTPSLFSRDAKKRFRAVIRLYAGGRTAVLTHETEELGLNRALRLEVAELLAKAGRHEIDGLLEITTYRLGVPPDKPRFLESWCDIWSEDGRLSVSIPTLPYMGGKQVLHSKSQVMPGVASRADLATWVLQLNPTGRPISFTLTVFSAQGDRRQSPRLRVAPMGVYLERLDRVVPDLEAHLRPGGGFGSLLVEGDYKLMGYTLMEHLKGNQMTCLDHTAFFYNA